MQNKEPSKLHTVVISCFGSEIEEDEEMNKDNKRRENILRNIAVVTGAIKYFKCFYNYTQVISIVRRVQVNYTRMCISRMKQTPDKSLK